MLHSVGGGTGSGFGTCLTTNLCDDMPDTTVMNAMVSPFTFGEVCGALVCKFA
jgi:hypothetical protein